MTVRIRYQTSRWAVAVLAVVSVAACGGVDDDGAAIDGPRVDWIDDAIGAVEEHYGGPQEYFEVSATAERVSVIVAVDDATAAEQGFWDDESGLVDPTPVGPASGATFVADDLDFDPGRVLSRVASELPDSEIVDFAVTGASGGAVIYDAVLRSELGGTLLVRLGPDGLILGTQGQ